MPWLPTSDQQGQNPRGLLGHIGNIYLEGRASGHVAATLFTLNNRILQYTPLWIAFADIILALQTVQAMTHLSLPTKL